MEKIKIGNTFVGDRFPCFIIAEAGVNHNGNIEVAKQLIDVAVEANADAVKFQTFHSEDLVTMKSEMAPYQRKNIERNLTQYEMIKQIELKLEDFQILKEYCDNKGILFLTTPHSGGDVIDFVNALVPAFKIGSGDLTNIPFLKTIATRQKPIIVGTGMSTMTDVKDALKTIYSTDNRNVIMLHCTSNYPCQVEEVNLNAMRTMQKELDCMVGYSDHTMGITVPIIAAVLGAVIIEKHFTLDRNLPGPDHKASLEPPELKKNGE